MMHILIVDDHPSFRRGVKEILTEELDSAKIGEAGDAQEMLDLLRRKKWDLVIMDISMPGQTGPEALKALKEGVHPFPCWSCACTRKINMRSGCLKPAPTGI